VTESNGVWLYGIAERVDAASLRAVAGVGGGDVRTVATAGLTAVVSDVDLAQYGEIALRRNLEDLDWLAATARAHQRVIDVAARHGPVLPMRLATVYHGDEGVAALTARSADDFRSMLGRIGHRKEWGVKAYVAESRVPERSPAGVGAPAGPRAGSGAGSGVAYLRRRRDQLAASGAARQEAAASVQAIHSELSAYAVGTRLHPPQAPQLSGEKAVMLLNAAYLVDETRGTDFAAAVTAAGACHPAVRLVLTGPWPPYSFVDFTGTAGHDHPG
jgi:hypothetical protein